MSADLKKLAILQNLPTPTPPLFFQDGGDNSNTQIALLALWSVRRKLPVDHALRLTVRRFRESQQPDGHWKYSRGQEGEWGNCAMTCAGLLALAMGHALDLETTPDKKPHKGLRDKQIDAGMRFVGNVIGNYTPQKLPLRTYTLWSIERVGVLFVQDKIDGKEWYRWGMRILKQSQQPSGNWPEIHVFPDTVNTAFALLFLQQANLAEDLTEAIKPLELAGPAAAITKD